jgi:hypothetical protein
VGVFQGPAEPGGPARHIALLRLLHHGGNEGARLAHPLFPDPNNGVAFVPEN